MAYGFMQSYADNFDFEKSLSLESFSSLTYKNQRGEMSHEFSKISSNSGLRKIYDAYLDKVMNDAKNQNIEIDIWFAKIGYQESRKLLPMGFLNFLENIFHKVERYDSEKKYENFKDFLEVFLAYHKYFNPSAK